jgi:hypothetical protein
MVHWGSSFPSREIEALAFDALVRHMPEITGLRYEHNEGRATGAGPAGAPDFVVLDRERRIGIEVTELVRDAGQQIKATPAMQHQVAREAERLAIQRNHPPMAVYLHFWGAVPKQRFRPLAEELVKLVEKYMPNEGVNARLVNEHRQSLPPEITNVSIHRDGIYGITRWQSPQAYWVDQNALPAIQRAINRKGEKIGAYLNHCDACWLLLWVQVGSAAGAFEINSTALEAAYAAPFEQVLLWDAWREQIHKLRL